MVAAAKKPKVIDLVTVHTDIKNPKDLPWPYKNESVKHIDCIGQFEYIPGKLRPRVMEEMYRILIPGGTIKVISVYQNSDEAYLDYRYEWPPLCAQSFLPFGKDWRKLVNWTEDIKCDFDFGYNYALDEETANREIKQVQPFWIKRYSNCVRALHVTLTKKC